MRPLAGFLEGAERIMRLAVFVVGVVGLIIAASPALADPAQPPWHFTTGLDLLDHWQTGIAGVLAFAAGVATVVVAIWVIAATREQTGDDHSFGARTHLERRPGISRHARSGDGSRPRRGGFGKGLSAEFERRVHV